MKGSWFIFDTYRAHEDWCRWRAPFWHGSRVMDEHSHANYHLELSLLQDAAVNDAAQQTRRPREGEIAKRGWAPHR